MNKLATWFIGLMTIVLIIVAFLNFFAGIVGGIWLIFAGKWILVVIGFIIGLTMPWWYTLAMLPGFGLMALVSFAHKHKNMFLVSIFGFLAAFYTQIILGYWSFYVLRFYLEYAKEVNIIPLLLCAYATIIAPLAYMSKGESKDSIGPMIGMLNAIMSFIVLLVSIFAFHVFSMGPVFVIAFIFAFLSMTIVSPSLTESMNNN